MPVHVRYSFGGSSLVKFHTYTQISAGYDHIVLLRSDGNAVAIGCNEDGQCAIPRLDDGMAYGGMAYAQISAGYDHTVLLRSDGNAVAIGGNAYGQCAIPRLDDGMAYTQISAGYGHTVLLRSDGNAVANPAARRCNIPPLDDGMVYTQISAGYHHTVLLRSDGNAVAVGHNEDGQYNIPLPEPGIRFVGDLTCGRDLALQLEFVGEDDNSVTLICSTLVGEERLHLTARGVDSAWETHKSIARELKMNLWNLHLVLPDGQLLAKVCRANPGASIAEVTQRTSRTSNSQSLNHHQQLTQSDPVL